MSTLSPRISGALLDDWRPDVQQVLDEHHLVAWSPRVETRDRFSKELEPFLRRQRDADVCVLPGESITDLGSFCAALEAAVPGVELERTLEGARGAVSRLRPGSSRRSKYRYYLWREAHVLLRHDAALFGRVVDAMTGVAAESEYVDEDRLVLQRCVFIGGASLDAYADDPRGQFRRWMPDADGEPYWQIVTGVGRPPIAKRRIDGVR